MSEYAKPLKNTRLEAFCQYVVAGSSDKDAYTEAGYSARTAVGRANIIRKRDDVTGRIDYLLSKKARSMEVAYKTIHEKLGISKEWVLQKLIDIHDHALTGSPIVSGDGDIIGYRQNLPSAVKAVELIGKEIGMFTVKIESNPNDPLLSLLMRVQGSALPVAKKRQIIDVDTLDNDG